ncbi:hypothetical protein [Oceanispirochaeta sp.]|uniref:J domain-containing protein n=1 Tax=Oceanispirochaeta sp. TaxID=2035350 RepID=UPI002635602F|nr:hypothetical protein [Oceanispirochaeta sp.]MDA3956662.1 hypothetical protein [Oceanispirochaeta sp.]
MRMTLTREEEKAFFLLMGISGQGVNPGDEVSLKKAFRTKAKKAHPDLAVGLGIDPRIMQQRFQELNDAFNILMERLQKEPLPYTVCKKTPSKPDEPDRSVRAKNREAYKENISQKKSGRVKSDFTEKKKGTKDSGDFFYSGKTPARNLRFAEYLYYSGTISWTDLVQALVWQYRNRPKIGEMASETGLLVFEEILEILKEKKFGELFGEVAVRLGYLNRTNLTSLVREQKKLGLPIGHYFLSSHKMTQNILYKKLSENRRHNILFSDRSDS